MLGLQVSVNIDHFAFRHRYNRFLGGGGFARDNASINVLAAFFAQLPHCVDSLDVNAIHFFDGLYDLKLVGSQFDLKSVLSQLIQARHLLRDDWSFQYVHKFTGQKSFENLTVPLR